MSDGKPIYKGYTIRVTVDTIDRIFIGHVLDIEPDIVSFHGETFDEFEQAFRDVIDSYIAEGGKSS